MRKVTLYWGTAKAISGLLAVKVKEASCPTKTELETCWLTAIDGPIAAADVAPTVRKPATTLMVTRKANVARRCARANKPMDWPLTNSPRGKGQTLSPNNTNPLRLNPPHSCTNYGTGCHASYRRKPGRHAISASTPTMHKIPPLTTAVRTSNQSAIAPARKSPR